MNNYFPIRNHSHYSLLSSSIKIDKLVEKCKLNNYPAVGLTDFTTISGAVSLVKTCKDSGIKPIIGCELVISDHSVEKPTSIVLLCKNLAGWKKLLKIISESNDKENYLKYPSLSRKRFDQLDLSDFVVIDGYCGSLLHGEIIHDFRGSYIQLDYDELAEDCLNRDWKEKLVTHYSRMLERFGEDYYIELPIFKPDTFPIQNMLKGCIFEVIGRDWDNYLYENDSYYLNTEDAADQRVLIASKLKTTLRELSSEILINDNYQNNKFLLTSSFAVPERETLSSYTTAHRSILEKIEDFDILSPPVLPRFECPEGKSEIEYLKDLCRIGWKAKIIPLALSKENVEEYKNRIIYELGVIEEAGLAGYLLIVQDYVNHFRNKGYLIGPGRGSAAGCLISFLLGITLIDPIKYSLLFERFYNNSRRGSLPDIDIDFPPSIREDVIEYLRQKYGNENVGQMLTLGRLSGRSILKEVLRIGEYCSFDEMNKITENLPQEGAISDQLEEMDEPSIIMWALEHNADKLKDYCRVIDGKLEGEYARPFTQSLNLENTYKSIGKHAAGVIVSKDKLSDVCPMVKAARSSDKICGFEMGHLEAIGCVKLDILGVSCLEKIQETCKEIE